MSNIVNPVEDLLFHNFVRRNADYDWEYPVNDMKHFSLDSIKNLEDRKLARSMDSYFTPMFINYRDWFNLNWSSFHPFVISQDIATAVHNEYSKQFRDMYEEKFDGRLRLPFNRMAIELDTKGPLFTRATAYDFIRGENKGKMVALLLYQYEPLSLFGLHLNGGILFITHFFFQESDSPLARRLNFTSDKRVIMASQTDVIITAGDETAVYGFEDNEIDDNNNYRYLSNFCKILHNLSAMTVIKMNKRPKFKKINKKERKNIPSKYVLIMSKKERKEFLKKRSRGPGREWSHSWETMGHYRNIMGKNGHDMDGTPMKDWTWVNSHWKNKNAKKVIQKIRIVGKDNHLIPQVRMQR